jgi:hypothetical protein
MPALGTTTGLRTAYASAPAGVDIWPTLELAHPYFTKTYYLTSAPAAFTARLETTGNPTVTFQPFPFAVVLPTVDGAGQQDLQVTLTNADQTIADEVQNAHHYPQLLISAVYREFLSTGDATQLPQSAPLRLSFTSIQITEDAVSGVAGRSDVLNRRFPGVWYDVAKFPGLDR